MWRVELHFPEADPPARLVHDAVPETARVADLLGGHLEPQRGGAGEVLNAVSVTEPDFGSDVANITATATPSDDGWVINGVKTWCTFAARADVILLLARTDPDRTKGHRGLSLFIVPKERAPGHGFVLTQDGGGKLEAGKRVTIHGNVESGGFGIHMTGTPSIKVTKVEPA